MLIKGKWHDKGSAAQLGAVLRFENDHYTVEVDNGKVIYGELKQLKCSDRLARVERKLTLQDGSIFATHDNDAIDSLIKENKTFNSFLYQIESNISWVIAAVIITVLVTGAFFKWGLPWSSTKLAHALPHKTNEVIASHTLDFLDEYVFEEESSIDPIKAERIREHFYTKLVPLEQQAQDINYKLHFRNWEFDDEAIPNALALPSGDIILTDKFVELCENQNEMDSVLLHEMGHVVHRHSLQMLIQGTIMTTVIMIATGDNNGLADFGLGLGSVLVASSYSRGHESEADVYAFEKMLEAEIDPQAFSSIMDRMTQYMENLEKFDSDNDKEADDENTADVSVKENKQNESEIGDKDKSSILDYLDSHPNTDDRIEQAQHYSDCFQKGLKVCPPLVQE